MIKISDKNHLEERRFILGSWFQRSLSIRGRLHRPGPKMGRHIMGKGLVEESCSAQDSVRNQSQKKEGQPGRCTCSRPAPSDPLLATSYLLPLSRPFRLGRTDQVAARHSIIPHSCVNTGTWRDHLMSKPQRHGTLR